MASDSRVGLRQLPLYGPREPIQIALDTRMTYEESSQLLDFFQCAFQLHLAWVFQNLDDVLHRFLEIIFARMHDYLVYLLGNALRPWQQFSVDVHGLSLLRMMPFLNLANPEGEAKNDDWKFIVLLNGRILKCPE